MKESLTFVWCCRTCSYFYGIGCHCLLLQTSNQPHFCVVSDWDYILVERWAGRWGRGWHLGETPAKRETTLINQQTGSLYRGQFVRKVRLEEFPVVFVVTKVYILSELRLLLFGTIKIFFCVVFFLNQNKKLKTET